MSKDSWETPGWLFDELNAEFNFQVDLCATHENAKCGWYYSDYFTNKVNLLWVPSDTLTRSLAGNFSSAFMNPPYSNPYPFVKKAVDDWVVAMPWKSDDYRKWHETSNITIVMLLPVRTSTKYWKLLWDYDNHSPIAGVEVRFLPKRIKFETDGKPSNGTPTFDCAIVILRGTT